MVGGAKAPDPGASVTVESDIRGGILPPSPQSPLPSGSGGDVPHSMLVIRRAMERALQSGIAGAGAMTVDVFLLMWLRTTMNYQYRHGTTMKETFAELWRQGGVRRFYRGFGFALFEGPLSRFTSTATNMAAFEIMDSFDATRGTSIAVKTLCASTASGILRLAYFPVDTCKCILQVEGQDGLKILAQKIRHSGSAVLWHGGLSAATNTGTRHFLWFVTHNYLDTFLPGSSSSSSGGGSSWGSFRERDSLPRHAAIGLACALVSNCVSNPFAVIKTYRQTSSLPVSYSQALVQITKTGGVLSLFYRGLGTRLWVDAINSIIFTVLWKRFLRTSTGGHDGKGAAASVVASDTGSGPASPAADKPFCQTRV